jgi:hypothetical protein
LRNLLVYQLSRPTPLQNRQSSHIPHRTRIVIPSPADFLTVLLIVLVGVLVWFALSPFETLGWWAGWFGDRIYWPTEPTETQPHGGEINAYIVFFSGIGRATGETLSHREREFVRLLGEAMPRTVVIDDIFPYATNNLALTEQPWLKSFWRFSLRSKMGNVPIAGYLINLRNIAQILISADRRYGPIFNQGVAEVIVSGLLRHGYPLSSSPNGVYARPPVYLIGYSGAGQTALGASTYVKEWLNCPPHRNLVGRSLLQRSIAAANRPSLPPGWQQRRDREGGSYCAGTLASVADK